MTELHLHEAEHGIDLQDRLTRAEVVKWIVDTECDYAVTLALNSSMSLTRARERLSEWLYRMDWITRRCRPERLPHDARLLAFIIPEHMETNIHFHLAMRLVDGHDVTDASVETVIKIAERQWSAIQPSGTIKIKPILDVDGWGNYITKDHYKRGVQLILSSDFANPTRFKRWQHEKSVSAWA